MICYPKLNSGVIKGGIDEDVKKMIELEKGWRFSLSKRKDIDNE